MAKYRFTLNIGYGRGASQDDEFEFPDEITEKELDQEWHEWASNYIDGGYDKIGD